MAAAERSTPEQRAAAIEVYREHGLAEAHRITQVPKPTLHLWARQAGLDPSVLSASNVAQTEAANAARAARMGELRLDLREQLLEVASDMLERTRQPHIDYRGKDSDRVEFDQAPADACRNYLVAAAVAIDKFRLEMGESTARTEIEHGPIDQQAARVKQMRDELGERRRAKPGEREAAEAV